MSNTLKFGPRRACQDDIEEREFAASQAFREDGAAFVAANSSGLMLAADASTAGLFGYALLGFSPSAPRVDETGTYGQRVLTTASGDKFQVYSGDLATSFRVPSDASFAGVVGLDCDLVVSSSKQMADIGTSSTNVLRIVGGISGESVVDVKINTAQVAADS